MPIANKIIQILIVDDHPLVRSGLRTLVESDVGFAIVGEASNGRMAIDEAKRLLPDIVILDVSIPELNGIEVCRQIKHHHSKAEILIFTMHESRELLKRALEAGASGFLLKSDPPFHVLQALRALSLHRNYLTPSLSGQVISTLLARSSKDVDKSSEITPRESEILQLLAEGYSNKEIAVKLSISMKTVETHRTSLMRKTGSRSIVDLVKFAIRNYFAH